MTKYQFEVELEDDKYCDSCKLFTSFDPYDGGGYCFILAEIDACYKDYTARPDNCPLVKVEGEK